MNTTSLALIVVAVIAVAGVGTAIVIANNNSDDRDTITVTMSWEKDIAEQIAGGNYRVVSMMGSDVSPHEAYSTPSNISDLYKSKIYFKIGSGVEWETAFMDAVSKDIPSSVKVVDIAASIEYTPLPNSHHHHDPGHEHEESANDAHIWTSPDILRKVAVLMKDRISEIDPSHASDYAANLDKYNAKADAVDAKMQSVAALAGPGHTHVMVWHPAWNYLLEQYAERFGADFHQESVEADGEVSPAEAAQMVKDEGCKAIYVSTTDEGYEGKAALEEAGITVHVVKPTATDMRASLTEFLEFLESDLKA